MNKRLPILAAAMMIALGMMASPASANVEVTDNGAGSNNYVLVQESHVSTSTQSNYADTKNDVNVSLNSGGNSVSGNTGGDNGVMTGVAHAEVLVVNDINHNYMMGSGCCPTVGSGDVKVTDNGAKSRNTVIQKSSILDVRAQTNKARTTTNVDLDLSSGKNVVSKNTGGNNGVDTGDLHAEVGIVNEINYNEMESSDCGCPEGESEVVVSDNGYKSKNTVKDYTTMVEVESQVNDARTRVGIDLEGQSGKNSLTKNTGGSSSASTGNLSAFLSVFNQVNRNFMW